MARLQSNRHVAKFLAMLAACLPILLLSPSLVNAQPVPRLYAINGDTKHLVSFYANAPAVFVTDTIIHGLAATDTIIGIDFRPANGKLYALIAVTATTARFATIDVATGIVATIDPAAPLINISGAGFGVAFNPVADRLRVVSDTDINLRLDPNTGTLGVTDAVLAYAAGDPNSGADPSVVHVAYTNGFLGAPFTTEYGIDTNLDVLVTVNPPNNGTLNTVGPLGVNASDVGGFDIHPNSSIGYAALRVANVSTLYQINLTSGAATAVGPIGSGTNFITGLALAPVTECLDIDGNGSIDPLTDGLMLLRAMFGSTGSGVTNGATADPLPLRTAWTDLRGFLNQYCGTSFGP